VEEIKGGPEDEPDSVIAGKKKGEGRRLKKHARNRERFLRKL
jgi:hypothetical protein